MKMTLFQNEKYTPVWAPLFVRLALGTIFLAHGSQKVFGVFGGPGIPGVSQMITSMGLKPVVLWTWALALTEFLGGLGILFGLFTRLAAFGITVVMLVAVITVHGKNGFFLSSGGFEFNLALIAMALSLIASGAGRFSLDWLLGRWWGGRRGEF